MATTVKSLQLYGRAANPRIAINRLRLKYFTTHILLLACAWVATPLTTQCQNIKWPERWPASMSIKTSYCCGTRPDSKTIYIAAQNSYIDEQTTPEKPSQRLPLAFNETELNELLLILKKHNVASLKSTARKQPGADNSMMAIVFSYNGKDYPASINNKEQLSTQAKERFDIIFNYIEKLADKKRLTSKASFVFSFHRSIIQSGKDLRVRVDEANITINLKADQIPSSIVVDLLPLTYTMHVMLLNHTENEDAASESYFAEKHLNVDTQKHQRLTWLIEGGQLAFN